MVADTPSQPIGLKMFCCQILNDHEALANESAQYENLPVVRNVTSEIVRENYQQVKKDIASVIKSELYRISITPELWHMLME
jgi:hypothetical protein